MSPAIHPNLFYGIYGLVIYGEVLLVKQKPEILDQNFQNVFFEFTLLQIENTLIEQIHASY